MIKIAHTGDVHVCPKHKEEAFASLRTLIKTSRKEEIDLFAFSADLFDSSMQNTEADGFPELNDLIQEMLNIAPIVTVYGTKTHDMAGCYDVFTRLSAKYTFTILETGRSYFLNENKKISESSLNAKLLILGCPEPQKNWFIGNNKAMSREESNRAIIDGMKNIFLGLGAIRKEYSDLPCLMVYHGNIAGSTLQNGQLLSQSDITIGKDDLSMIGADYYALGHIHLYQELFPNAFYSGSAYPVNWGERDQKAFNLVGFDWPNNKTIIFRKINYPHAPLKKIEISYSELQDGMFVDYKGFKTWVEIECDNDESEYIDAEEWANDMIKLGALPGSKVTIRKIASETVRAQEIQSVKHLKDKLKVYAEASSLTDPKDSILEKADQLEKELYQNGSKFHELNIRMKSLHLRGAIGIMKKSGKEEIKVDFENYEPGLIALIGQNGAGKTTLLENLHPYPSLLTRSGKLQDHFQLKDSFRDLYFIDERTGVEYRAFIQIDGQNQSGKVDYNVFRKNEAGTFEPLTNGRAKDYEEKIIELFGSLDLFLKSAFITQKPPKGSPDLSDATKGQRKALFLELAGLEKYQKFSENSKEKRKNLENSILKTSGQIETLKADIENKPDLEKNISELKEKVNLLFDELSALETKGKKAKEELETLEKESLENDKLVPEINHLRKKIEETKIKIEENNNKIKEYEKALLLKDKHQENIVLYDSVSKKIKDVHSQNEEIRKKNSDLKDSYRSKLSGHTEKEIDIINDIHDTKIELNDSESSFYNLREENSKTLQEIKKIEQSKKCPTCGQELPEEAKENIRKKIHEMSNKMFLNKPFMEQCEKEIEDFNKKLKTLEEKKENLLFSKPKEPDYLKEIDYSQFQSILDKINIEESKNIISEALKAEFVIKETRSENLSLASNNEYDKVKFEKLNNKYDDKIAGFLFSKKREYEKLKDDYSDKLSEKKGAESKLDFLIGSFNELQAKENKLHELEKETSETKQEISDWSYLEKACGPDGIQALELDALSPNIESEVNQILRSAYGDRFSIKFETTRIGGTGKNTKQIEDFLIMVNDNGHIQELSTLSGGEEVWIKKAIYDAFGIIRNQNTGTNFLTVCMDEADGALDHESKQQYLKMVQASHIQSGKHHTILITHDPFIQQQVSQKIIMSEL